MVFAQLRVVFAQLKKVFGELRAALFHLNKLFNKPRVAELEGGKTGVVHLNEYRVGIEYKEQLIILLSMISAQDFRLFATQLRRFSPLTEEEAGMLFQLTEELTLAKGELFACEGRKEIWVGFVLEGNLRHYYTRDGEEKTTYFFFENHLVCAYVSCLTGAPSLLTIEALSPCRLLRFRYADLQRLYDTSPAWGTFGRKLAEYIVIGLEERMTGLLIQSPEERYKALLESGKDKILARIPQHYIANYLGITPVSLSRIRNRVARPK